MTCHPVSRPQKWSAGCLLQHTPFMPCPLCGSWLPISWIIFMWHKYNPWGYDVKHAISRSIGQRSRSHGLLEFSWSGLQFLVANNMYSFVILIITLVQVANSVYPFTILVVTLFQIARRMYPLIIVVALFQIARRMFLLTAVVTLFQIVRILYSSIIFFFFFSDCL